MESHCLLRTRFFLQKGRNLAVEKKSKWVSWELWGKVWSHTLTNGRLSQDPQRSMEVDIYPMELYTKGSTKKYGSGYPVEWYPKVFCFTTAVKAVAIVGMWGLNSMTPGEAKAFSPGTFPLAKRKPRCASDQVPWDSVFASARVPFNQAWFGESRPTKSPSLLPQERLRITKRMVSKVNFHGPFKIKSESTSQSCILLLNCNRPQIKMDFKKEAFWDIPWDMEILCIV